jgi:Na+-transporting methylmalonyl-CoA/oxaloacetate decarboxylase beta subunit
MEVLEQLYNMTALGAIAENPGVLLMSLIGAFLLFLGIVKKYEPLLLVPSGFGIILANLPG